MVVSYEIGQRFAQFDDVPDAEVASRLPHIFIAGDACHTHSPRRTGNERIHAGHVQSAGNCRRSTGVGAHPSFCIPTRRNVRPLPRS